MSMSASAHSLPLSHQTIVAEHEIRNISCAAQDPDDLCTFAYITKDLKSGHHFCHVFSTVEVVSDFLFFLPVHSNHLSLNSVCQLAHDVAENFYKTITGLLRVSN